MPSVHRLRAVTPEPVAMHSHAMDNLRFIRDTMDARDPSRSAGMGRRGHGRLGPDRLGVAHFQPSLARWFGTWLAEAVLAL
jgi:hypothetical protein